MMERWVDEGGIYMDKSKKNIIMVDGWEHVHCPVCGNLVETYDICDVCHWQNTGAFNIDGGPNKMTLAEAKEAYAKGLPIR